MWRLLLALKSVILILYCISRAVHREYGHMLKRSVTYNFLSPIIPETNLEAWGLLVQSISLLLEFVLGVVRDRTYLKLIEPRVHVTHLPIVHVVSACLSYLADEGPDRLTAEIDIMTGRLVNSFADANLDHIYHSYLSFLSISKTNILLVLYLDDGILYI